MTRIILGLILVAISLQSHGQIKVTGFEAKPMDLTASTHMRRDFNEQPCALVKVGLRAKDASFEGNIIGDTEMHTNEYWVYMTGGSKMLNIKHISAPSLLVRFSDYGVEALEPKMTYMLDLELPQPVAEQQVMQKVIINFSPSRAVVLLDGQMLDTDNGVATASLPAGKDYSYTVAAKGYESSEGNFRLKATAPARLNIQLYPLETASTQITQTKEQQPAVTAATAVVTDSQSSIISAADKAFAEKLYSVAMENYLKFQDNAYAQMKIGHMYSNGLGVKQDYDEAFRWYYKSASQGYAGGQVAAGFAYELGRGVKKDYKTAVSWFEKAVSQSEPYAINALAYMYETGHGVKKNESEAVRLYNQASDMQNRSAQNNLGCLYKEGNAVKKDEILAADLLKKSADQNSINGCFSYGLMLYGGIGVKEDKEAGEKLMKLAKEMGNKNAEKFLSSQRTGSKILRGIAAIYTMGVTEIARKTNIDRKDSYYRELEWIDFSMK